MTVVAWLLVGVGEGLVAFGRGAPWGPLVLLVAAWGGVGVILRRWPSLSSTWIPVFLQVFASALVQLGLDGVAGIFAAEGALVGLVGAVWLLRRWPGAGVLFVLPATLAGAQMRQIRPVLKWPDPVVEGRKGPGPRVVLLTIDTLRADVGRSLPTYNLVALSGRSGPTRSLSPWTVPSLGTLLTGQDAYTHGAVIRPPKAGKTRIGRLSVPTLARRFQDAGWATAAFVENPFIAPERGFQDGFSVWDHRELRRPARTLLLDPVGLGLDLRPLKVVGRNADARVDAALSWMIAQEGPLFLWVHLLGPHLPYYHADFSEGTALGDMLGPDGHSRLTTEELRRGTLRWTPQLRQEIKDAYRQEALRADQAMGRLVAAAGSDAIVLYTSDHGEEFGDHGGWEHGHSLYDELLQVPLAFRAPGLAPGSWSGQATLLDVAPTLLALAGLPAEQLPGADLRGEPPSRRLLLANTLYDAELDGTLEWPLKYVRSLDYTMQRLVDLSVDPREERDLCAERAGDCAREAEWLQQRAAELGETPEGEVDAAVRALGYRE